MILGINKKHKQHKRNTKHSLVTSPLPLSLSLSLSLFPPPSHHNRFLASGAIVFPLVEPEGSDLTNILNCVYFGMVTITTVGYGDMGPSSVPGRIFTSLYVMGGVGLIGVAIGIVGGYVMEQQEKITKEMLKKAQELALNDQDSSSDSDDDEKGGAAKKAQLHMLAMQKKFDKSPAGCLYRFGKKWLKIFMPVIVVLGIGMAVMMTQETGEFLFVFLVFFVFFLLFKLVCFCFCFFSFSHFSSSNLNYFQDPQITLCEGTPEEDTTLCLFANQTYGMTFVNAIYWGVVSGTTVGYGDISPSNDGTKIFCMFFLVFAVITTANALGTVGDALMEGSDGQVMSILDKKLDAAFLMSIDMDGSGEVTEFEYLAAMVSSLMFDLYFF